jgi:hypothetical protein
VTVLRDVTGIKRMVWIITGIISAFIIAGANVAATRFISSAPAYEPEQKRMQIVIIWLVPIIGAALFSYFLWHDRKDYKQKREIGNNTSISDQDSVNHYFGAN